MLKVKIHPLFALLGVFYVVKGAGADFLCFFIAVLTHEAAHAKAASIRGYKLVNVKLMPYGAVLCGGENFSRTDNLIISLAGPLFNFTVSVLLAALWWLAPVTYNFTDKFCAANLSVALMNMLPVFPLDGARFLLALSRDKLRSLKRLRIAGIVCGAIFMALHIASLFYVYNPTLGIMAVFLFHGAASGTEKERYVHIANSAPFTKNLKDGIDVRELIVGADAELYRLLERIKADRVYTFRIVDGDMREIASVRESELEDIFVKYPLDTKIADVREITGGDR